MTAPIVIQILKYIHVLNGKFSIKNKQHTIETLGNTGTKGTINPRFKFGCDLRRIITDRQTNANVTKLPILTKLTNSFKSINPAIIELPIPANPVIKSGCSSFLINFRK